MENNKAPQNTAPEAINTDTQLTQAEKPSEIQDIQAENFADEIADILGL